MTPPPPLDQGDGRQGYPAYLRTEGKAATDEELEKTRPHHNQCIGSCEGLFKGGVSGLLSQALFVSRRHRIRLQSYLRPLGGALSAPSHDGKCARGCQSLVRPSMASPEVGVSPRRSDRCAILCAAVLLNVGRGSVVRAVLRGDAGLAGWPYT